MNDVFHPQHISCIKASELAFEDCLCAKRWKDAIEYGSLCLESYKKYTLGDQVRSLQKQLHFVYMFCILLPGLGKFRSFKLQTCIGSRE